MGKSARLYDYNSRSKQEVDVLHMEINDSISKWLEKIKKCSNQLEKQGVLKLLITDTINDKEPHDVIAQVVARAHLGLELEVILKETRWVNAHKLTLPPLFRN